MNVFRIRAQALRSAQKSIRLYTSSSNPSLKHTPDTYRKDEAVVPPESSKTHVVGGHDGENARTQRPFEPPTGSYTTVSASKPYDSSVKNPEEGRSKLRDGGTDWGTKSTHDGHDSPQGKAGKRGRE